MTAFEVSFSSPRPPWLRVVGFSSTHSWYFFKECLHCDGCINTNPSIHSSSGYVCHFACLVMEGVYHRGPLLLWVMVENREICWLMMVMVVVLDVVLGSFASTSHPTCTASASIWRMLWYSCLSPDFKVFELFCRSVNCSTADFFQEHGMCPRCPLLCACLLSFSMFCCFMCVTVTPPLWPS